MTDQATVETRDHVLRFTFNRPDKKNALTGAMYAAFADALESAAADPAVRVVLVSGAGDAFTSGNDLKDFATWGSESDVEALPVVRAVRRVLSFPKPLVAAVRGVAVGFGTTLLPHCDAVLAMYHDQGLPVLKYKGFGAAVNVTLGLPIIRTSVDHGTALDLAGTGRIDGGSLQVALETAYQMAASRIDS